MKPNQKILKREKTPLRYLSRNKKASFAESKPENLGRITVPCIAIRGASYSIFSPMGCWAFEVGRHTFFQSATQFGFSKFYSTSKVTSNLQVASEMGEYMRLVRILSYDVVPKHLEHAREFGFFRLQNLEFIPGSYTIFLGEGKFQELYTPEETSEFLHGL